MKTRWHLLAVVIMMGCRVSDVMYLPGSDASSGEGDANGAFCYGSVPFRICFAAAPSGMINIAMTTTTTTFDTGTGSSDGTQLTCSTPMSGGDGSCVLAAATITINSPLRAVGTKPLVLVAADSIDVPASLDVGSHQQPTESIGAGAAPREACASGEEPGFSGGGAGGSFLGRGGTGGNGDEVNGGGIPGAPSDPPTALHGGCPGQDGQPLALSTERGVGGHGGGAVFLIAGSSITVSGTINAGGEGGGGGGNPGSDAPAGGGGGGAGGMIGFDAPSIMVTSTGTLIANGGGGGEGSSDANGAPGRGRSGTDALSTNTAAGGGNDTNGGNGGDGSAGAANSSGLTGASASGGGGGGGGGAGVIKAPATANLGSSVSPAPTR